MTGPLALLRDRLGVEVVEAEIGDGGDDERTLAALAGRRRPAGRTRAVVASHVTWSTGAVLPARGDRRAGPGRRGGQRPRRGAVGGRDPARRRRDRRRLLRRQRPEVAARARWDRGARRPPRDRARRAPAGGRVLRRLDAVRRWPRRAVAGRTRASRRPASTSRRSWAWRAAQAGSACSSACRGPTSGRRDWRPRPPIAWPRRPGSPCVTPRRQMATLVSFRVAGWTGDQVAEALGRRVHAIVRSIPGLDAVRLSVAFFTTEDELRRVLDAVEEIAAHTPATLPARPGDRVPGPSAARDRAGGRPVRQRGWLEVRWRQLRRAPTPVVRAVASSVAVAAVLGVLFLAYDLALDAGAELPGGDLRVLAGFVFVAAVAILGCVAHVPRRSAAGPARRPEPVERRPRPVRGAADRVPRARHPLPDREAAARPVAVEPPGGVRSTGVGARTHHRVRAGGTCHWSGVGYAAGAIIWPGRTCAPVAVRWKI